jgi:hypothetical protein
MKFLVSCFAIVLFFTQVYAQDLRSGNLVDEEEEIQNQVLKKKNKSIQEVPESRKVDRFPNPDPMFKKPPGPVQGGTLKVEHPRAAEGLIRINKDGSYQYRTKVKDRSKSSSFKIGVMSPPEIDSGNAAINYKSMYGSRDIFALLFDYEWEPFSSTKNIGIKFGTGLATATGQGFFKVSKTGRGPRSEEKYTLFMVPLSAFLNYRFEYNKKQWFVPYLSAGATFFGMGEFRNDQAEPSFAGAAAAGGGGGVLIPLSRLDDHNAFTLSEEYGIADMWLAVEYIAMQGLSEDIDFTHQQINMGIQVDF